MAKRKISDEINLLKERGEFENGLFNFQRFYNIEELLKIIKSESKQVVDELYKYLPIATVACMESFYRESIKSLIDKGGKYFDNLETLLSKNSQKIDFEILYNLQKKQFTIGEFVSHTLSCSTLNDLENNLSILLGESFLNTLKNYKPITFGEYDEESFLKLQTNFEDIKMSIIRMFHFRHIFCHESAINVDIDKEIMVNDFENCKLFLENSSNFICSIIYNNWGLTTHKKIEVASKEIEFKSANLELKIQESRKANAKNIQEKLYSPQSKEQLEIEFYEKFDKTISLWREFIEAKAILRSSLSVSYINSQHIYVKDKLKSIERALSNGIV